MKKFLFLSILSASFLMINNAAQAQRDRPKSIKLYTVDTSTNADTVYIPYAADDNIASISGEVKKVSGTPAGKIYMWGINNPATDQWVLLDSSSALQNQAWNVKHFLFDKTKYTYFTYYRLELRTTGTQRSTLSGTVQRRPDEH